MKIDCAFGDTRRRGDLINRRALVTRCDEQVERGREDLVERILTLRSSVCAHGFALMVS